MRVWTVQNFAAIRAVYTEKLKKMRDASKPGAIAPAPAPTLGVSVVRFVFTAGLTHPTDPKLQARKARKHIPLTYFSTLC